MTEIFRMAAGTDFDEICSMFRQAVARMNVQNIDQWDEQYPTAKDIHADIEKKQMFILLQDGRVVSAVVLNEKQDEEYAKGQWNHADAGFAVIHRLCVHPDVQKQGIGRKTLAFAETYLYDRGYAAVRLDAFSENPHALKLYERLGYSRVGEVSFRKGRFYLFEKSLRSE